MSCMAYLRKWKRIVAIVPITRKNGRTSSLVYYDDGSHERFECRCERIVEVLALHFSTTREQARRWSAATIGKGGQRKPPLVLQEHFCLVQVKCRPESRHNSGTLGYLVLQKIGQVQAHGAGSRVQFHKNGGHLDIVQKQRSVTEQINLAWTLVEQYRVLREQD